jgi:hypothetical protein
MHVSQGYIIVLMYLSCLPCLPLQDATSSLERLRTDLRSWTAKVEAGELQDLGKEKQPAGAYSESGAEQKW